MRLLLITLRRCRTLRVSPVSGRLARRVVRVQCSSWAVAGMALRRVWAAILLRLPEPAWSVELEWLAGALRREEKT